MLSDEDIKKLIDVFATKEDLKEVVGNLSTKDDFNQLFIPEVRNQWRSWENRGNYMYAWNNNEIKNVRLLGRYRIFKCWG